MSNHRYPAIRPEDLRGHHAPTHDDWVHVAVARLKEENREAYMHLDALRKQLKKVEKKNREATQKSIIWELAAKQLKKELDDLRGTPLMKIRTRVLDI